MDVVAEGRQHLTWFDPTGRLRRPHLSLLCSTQLIRDPLRRRRVRGLQSDDVRRAEQSDFDHRGDEDGIARILRQRRIDEAKQRIEEVEPTIEAMMIDETVNAPTLCRRPSSGGR